MINPKPNESLKELLNNRLNNRYNLTNSDLDIFEKNMNEQNDKIDEKTKYKIIKVFQRIDMKYTFIYNLKYCFYVWKHKSRGDNKFLKIINYIIYKNKIMQICFKKMVYSYE